MKPAFTQFNTYQEPANSEKDLLMIPSGDSTWDFHPGHSKAEKEFNFLKYVLLTGVVVLLIALTVFMSNRNQVSAQERDTTSAINFYVHK